MKYRKGLVSVIVPVYNTDPILMEKCLQSLMKQTYNNLEVLVINDGSSRKKTISFLRKAETDNKKLFVINKRNGGVSSARNRGLKEASGEFVYFLDSDDYIGQNTIQKLVEIMNSEKYIEVISRQITISDGYQKEVGCIPEGEIDSRIHRKLIFLNTLNFASHGTLVRTSIAKKYCFDESIKYGEDFQYNFKVMMNGKAFYTNKCDYFYYQNPQSTLNTIDKKNAFRYLRDFNNIYTEIISAQQDIDIARYMMCDKINLTLKRLYVSHNLKYREYRELSEKFRALLIENRIPRLEANFSRNVLVFLFYKKKYAIHFVIVVLWSALIKIRSKK